MEEVEYKIDDAVSDVEVGEEQPELEIETHILFKPQRLENENFDDYKKRRLVAHHKLHEMSKGKMIWNSRPDQFAKGKTFRKQK